MHGFSSAQDLSAYALHYSGSEKHIDAQNLAHPMRAISEASSRASSSPSSRDSRPGASIVQSEPIPKSSSAASSSSGHTHEVGHRHRVDVDTRRHTHALARMGSKHEAHKKSNFLRNRLAAMSRGSQRHGIDDQEEQHVSQMSGPLAQQRDALMNLSMVCNQIVQLDNERTITDAEQVGRHAVLQTELLNLFEVVQFNIQEFAVSKIQNGKELPLRAKKRKTMEMRTLFYETFVQMADLSGDLLLLHVLKAGRDEDLYWIGISLLSFCMFVRLISTLRLWPRVDPMRRCRYFSGVSINLFAPSAGLRLVKGSLRKSGVAGTVWDQEMQTDVVKSLDQFVTMSQIDLSGAILEMWNIGTMILIEDVPMLLIAIIYILREEAFFDVDGQAELAPAILTTLVNLVFQTMEFVTNWRATRLLRMHIKGRAFERRATDEEIMAHADEFTDVVRLVSMKNCNTVGDAGVERLALRCHNLQVFELTGSQILTDAGVRELARCCRNLKVVRLTKCGSITDVAVREIAKHSKFLTEIALGKCERIRGDSLPALARQCVAIRKVNLFSCQKIKCEHMAQFDSQWSNVEEFVLAQCSSLSRDIAPMLASCNRLRVLALSDIQAIDDNAVEQICKSCRMLRNLNVTRCGKLTDRALGYIAAGDGLQLKVLNLSRRKKDAVGGTTSPHEGGTSFSDMAVARLLESCALWLHILVLAHNTDVGICTFHALQNHGKQMITLNIAGCVAMRPFLRTTEEQAIFASNMPSLQSLFFPVPIRLSNDHPVHRRRSSLMAMISLQPRQSEDEHVSKLRAPDLARLREFVTETRNSMNLGRPSTELNELDAWIGEDQRAADEADSRAHRSTGLYHHDGTNNPLARQISRQAQSRTQTENSELKTCGRNAALAL